MSEEENGKTFNGDDAREVEGTMVFTTDGEQNLQKTALSPAYLEAVEAVNDLLEMRGAAEIRVQLNNHFLKLANDPRHGIEDDDLILFHHIFRIFNGF